MPKIPVSFKNTDAEMKLYSEVTGHSDRSAFTKEAISFYIKYRHLEYKLSELLESEKAKEGLQ